MIRAVLTDIEGTTSAISFVTEVLFPYSRARLADYVRAHAADLAEVLDGVRAQSQAHSLEDCIACLERWHDEDRKIAPLKELQGRIWAGGFADGALKGHVYPDAEAALRRWHAAGLALYVYSSGSVAAQKLLFGHSVAGDLCPLFAGHFDTTTGPKREAASYAAIAAQIGMAPDDILFLSDVEAELAAAHAAGFQTCLLVREGAPEPSGAFAEATSFDTIGAMA